MLGASLRAVSGTGRVTAAILLAGFVISLAVNLPGHLSYDSVVQLLEGRTGVYGGWHPPVMSWLLGLFDAVVPGASLFVLFDTLLLYGSLVALLLLAPRPSWLAPIVGFLIVVSPQFLLYSGIVWKDVLFAATAVSGFTALAFAAAHWREVRLRGAALGIALLLLSLAALTRQNGMVLAPFAALALGWIAARHAPEQRFMSAALYSSLALLSLVALVVAGSAALNLRWTGQAGPLNQLRQLETYDLEGALKADPSLDLDQVHDDDPALETILRRSAGVYTPASEEPLAKVDALNRALAQSDDETIPLQWRQFVLARPALYLDLRTQVFGWLVFTPDSKICRPAFTGVSADPAYMRQLGLVTRLDARDRALANYAMALAGTPVLSHAFWAVVALVLVVLLLRRRQPADVALAAMLGAGLAFAASFFFISLVCDYRYLYPLDAMTIAALFYVAASFPAPRLASLPWFTRRTRS